MELQLCCARPDCTSKTNENVNARSHTPWKHPVESVSPPGKCISNSPCVCPDSSYTLTLQPLLLNGLFRPASLFFERKASRSRNVIYKRSLIYVPRIFILTKRASIGPFFYSNNQLKLNRHSDTGSSKRAPQTGPIATLEQSNVLIIYAYRKPRMHFCRVYLIFFGCVELCREQGRVGKRSARQARVSFGKNVLLPPPRPSSSASEGS